MGNLHRQILDLTFLLIFRFGVLFDVVSLGLTFLEKILHQETEIKKIVSFDVHNRFDVCVQYHLKPFFPRET